MEAIGTEPFRVGALVWQSQPGAHVLTVVCKVTFQLAPGESRLAATPAALVPFDVATGSGERAQLTAASDLVPFKVSPEVIVTGHAYSPGGRPVLSLLARVAVGDVDKVLSVHGDRCFSPAGELSEALPFTRMPLSWDRAAGGPETANPAGVVTGPGARPDAAGRVYLPNLQPIGRYFPSRADVLAPVGLGPVAASWPDRRRYLGHHATTWDALRWNDRPLPPDFGGAYFQAAPPDQRVSELRPDARLFLENLSPRIPQLATRLPAVVPAAVVEMAGTSAPLRLRCDTLWIDADAETAVLVYRGSVPLDHPHREGRVLVTEESAQPVHRTMLGGMSAPALPFEPSGEVASMLSGLPPEVKSRMAARLAELGDLSRIAVSGTVLPIASTKPVLPFGDAGDGSTAPDTVPPPPPGSESGGDEDEEEDTADTHRPPPPSVSMPVHGLGGPPPPDTSVAAGPLPGFVIPAAWSGAGFSVKETMVLPEALPSPSSPPGIAPEPPALIGPLAKAVAEQSQTPSAPELGWPTPPSAPETGAPAVEEPLSIEEYPIERHARIAASVDLHEAESERILTENGLSEGTWERLRRHWSTAVNEEAARGKSTSMRAYDAAYIAQIEAERGPIEVAEYARISVAMDRGTVDEALAGMGLPRRAAMPIRRAWTARMFKDPKLAARVRHAVAEERER